MMTFKTISLIAGFSTLVITSTPAQVLYGAIGANGANGQLYTVDPATASTTLIGNILTGSTPIPIKGLAFSPIDNILYAVTANAGSFGHRLFTLDTTTGAATLIGNLGINAGDISFNSSGALFMWSGGNGNQLSSINLGTGTATPIGPSAGSASGAALSFNPSDSLYLSRTGDSGTLDTVNTATGAATAGPSMSSAPEGGNLTSMAFNHSGTLYAIDSNTGGTAISHLVTINTGTGLGK